MTVKNMVVGLGLGIAVYKFGKFVGKVECLDVLPDNEITIKLGRYGKLTVSKPKKK